MALREIVDLDLHPILDAPYQAACRNTLDQNGALVLDGFLTMAAVSAIAEEGVSKRENAYFCEQRHNVYLTPPDPAFSDTHARNRQVISSKGCICDDLIAQTSPLRTLYDDQDFKTFLCKVLGENQLYPYADSLSSINLHYAEMGQELGWHFDNSSFATTLLIQAPEGGGNFEYVANLRNAEEKEMNYDGVTAVLDGQRSIEKLSISVGALVLFRGRNAMHRVSPVEGNTTRMLAVLAYNSEPGVALSESAQMTFYGRLGKIA